MSVAPPGILVEVLRERGIDAQGCDVSQFAVDHAAPGAVGHVRVANLFAGLPWEDGAFELVTALEILEHLPPDRVAVALDRAPPGVRRLPLRHHPLLRNQRVRARRTLRGEGAARTGGALPPARCRTILGPVPEPDLAVDAEGQLVEGHLTIASFEWWTQQFELAGFTRCPDIERRLYADIEPGDLAPYWNIYVFKIDGAAGRACRADPTRPLPGRARASPPVVRTMSDSAAKSERLVLCGLRASAVRPSRARACC